MIVSINKINEIAQKKLNQYLKENDLSLQDVEIYVDGSKVFVVNLKNEDKIYV